MAKSTALFLLFLTSLIMCAIKDKTVLVEAENIIPCPKPSGLFKGWCFSSSNCNKTCLQEGALNGECQFDYYSEVIFSSRRCMCSYIWVQNVGCGVKAS
ncbi:hypothetical protein ACHQM5_000349 [Ranunculus cassubicifolius]